MKKLMMAAAIVCAAALSHGAACDWSASGMSASPDTALAAGWAAYLMPASTYTEFTALTSDKVAAYVTANAIDQAEMAYSRKAAIGGKTGDNYKVGDSESAYIVLFNNASADAATYYANTGTKTSDPVAESGADIALAYGTWNTSWNKIEAVPEPTSGLLLLLGVAGLALKRRRA